MFLKVCSNMGEDGAADMVDTIVRALPVHAHGDRNRELEWTAACRYQSVGSNLDAAGARMQHVSSLTRLFAG